MEQKASAKMKSWQMLFMCTAGTAILLMAMIQEHNDFKDPIGPVHAVSMTVLLFDVALFCGWGWIMLLQRFLRWRSGGDATASPPFPFDPPGESKHCGVPRSPKSPAPLIAHAIPSR
jgi:hypothetical protein